MPDLKKNFLSQFLLAFSQLIFPLATYPYLTRTLGPEGLGKTGYTEFVAGFIITVFSVGIPYYGLREISKARNDIAKRSRLVSDLLFIHIITSVAGILVFAALLQLNPNYENEKQLIILGSLYILFQVFTVDWYLQGAEAFQFIARRSIIIRLLGIGAIFLFVKKEDDYIIYYGIILTTQIIIAITAIIKMAKENKISFKNLRLKPHYKPLFYFFLTSSFISVYVFFDVIILGWLTSEEQVGYYSFALRIIKLPLLLLLTLNTIFFPRISFLQAEGNHEKIAGFLKFTIQFIFTITLPVCVCFYILSPEIIALLGGQGFTSSVTVMQILSPLPLLISLSNFFVVQVLAPTNKERSITITYLIASVISLALNFLLIPVLQEQGAATAMLITEAVIGLTGFYFAYSIIKKHFSYAALLTSLLLALLVIPITLLLRQLTDSAIYVLLFSLGIFGAIYFAMQYFILANEVMGSIVNLFIRSSNPKRFANEPNTEK